MSKINQEGQKEAGPDRATKLDRINGRLLAFYSGAAIASVVTAASIAIIVESSGISLKAAQLILGFLILIAVIAVLVWTFQRTLARRILGVDLKSMGQLISDAAEDIANGKVHNAGTRLREALALYAAHRIRSGFVAFLFVLLGEILLLVNAAYLVRQIEVSKTQTTAIEAQTVLLSTNLLDRQWTRFSDNEEFKKVISVIEDCQPVYVGYGGSFSHETVNAYLNFWEKIALYWKREQLTLEDVDQLFGSYIIEAHINPSIKKYISEFRKSYSDEEVFIGFTELAEVLEQLPHRAGFAKTWQDACN